MGSIKVLIELNGERWETDLNHPIDISLAIGTGPERPRAWYVPPVKIEPVMTDRFTGSVELGGAVNFRDIHFNPHGHGTHTECAGHITDQVHSINRHLRNYWFRCQVISISPAPFEGNATDWMHEGDRVISAKQLENATGGNPPEALAIRTLPNTVEKLNKNYSNTNPPFFDPEAMFWLRKKGVKHLLVDLPSVDREEDGGNLMAHHAFWNIPESPDLERTITEFIFIPDEITDGLYMLNLMVAAFENDATPSKPILYRLSKQNE